MSENWDELWKRKIEDEDWVVEKDWLFEVKAVGDEFRDKLKVIKKLVEKRSSLYMSTLEDYQQAVDDWLGKMMNILEGEV